VAISEDLRAEIAAHERTKQANEGLLKMMSEVVSQCGVEDVLALDDYTMSFKDNTLSVETTPKED